MTIHPDRQQPVPVPDEPGPALTEVLRELTPEPFTQAAILRVYANAPEHVKAVTRLRITAAIRADGTATT